MKISDEAVEAAAFAESERDRPGMWDHESETFKNALRRDARLHLEAAAPYLIAAAKADAWDEGSEARRAYQWNDDMEPLTNPYRHAGAGE